MKHSFLNILEKHTFIKWVFFIAAFIGAVTTIFTTWKALYSFFENQSKKYENIEKIEIGASIWYLKSILWEPNISKICEHNKEKYVSGHECPFPDISKNKYIYEKEDYLIEALTDSNNIINGYTIFLKNMDFHPKFNLKMDRWIWNKSVTLGKTTFADFDDIKDDFWFLIEDPYLGNRLASFSKLIYAQDYATDYFFVLNSIEPDETSKFYTDNKCQFYLLEDYEYGYWEGSRPMEKKKYDENLKKFKEKCIIQSISILSKENLEDTFWKLEDEDSIKVLKEQIKFFIFPST